MLEGKNSGSEPLHHRDVTWDIPIFHPYEILEGILCASLREILPQLSAILTLHNKQSEKQIALSIGQPTPIYKVLVTPAS